MKQLTDEVRDAQFEAWWEKSGQFCRSGGGAYEKTFAYTAWLAALDTAQPVQVNAMLVEALQAEVKHLNLHLKATQSGRDAALARLAELEKQFADAAKQQQSVPEGWKLVPIEPTHLQSKAAADAWLGCDSKLYLDKAMAAAKAMLSAAPQPKDMK